MPTLALDDGTIHYDVRGSGPPMVLLHGGWLDGDVWQPQIEGFAEEFRTITPDLRGHGRTGRTDPRRYTVDLLADDLQRLLAALDADRPILCGLSLGNLVVQALLDRHPNDARAAILAGPLRSMPPVDLPASFEPFLSPTAGVRTALGLAGSKATFRSLLGSIRATTGRPWLSVDAAVRSRAIETAGRTPRSEFRKIFDALYRFDPPDLGDVATPTLAVYGEREASLVIRQGHQVVEMVEDGRAVSIPDAAHLVNVDNPDRFNATVSAFLDGVGAATEAAAETVG